MIKKRIRIGLWGITLYLLCFLGGCADAILMAGASKNDVQMMQRAISEGASANDSGALHTAARQGNYNALKFLLDAGANPNIPGYHNRTPLITAATYNRPRIIELLLEYKADPNLVDKHSKSAAFWAAANNHLSIVELLIKANVNLELKENEYGKTALYEAVIKQHEQVVEALLKGGASPNTHQAEGTYLLTYAAFIKNEPIVEMLLHGGADPNVSDQHGFSALLYAAQNGNTRSLTALIDSGAELDYKSKAGNTALLEATLNNRSEAAEILLKKGADPNSHEVNSWFPLLAAVSHNNLKMVERLVSSNADLNMSNNFGTTALTLAAANGNIDIVKLLLNKGADPTIVQSDGSDALSVATSRNFITIATLIKSSLLAQTKRPEESSPNTPEYPPEKYNYYAGTGWLTEGGYIVTNNHVVDKQVEIKVRFNGIETETYGATIVLKDKHNDLAILQLDNQKKINTKGIPISRNLPNLGEDVFTIGYPKTNIMGKSPKITNGIVSSLSGIQDDPRIIQTTVAIQSGNSGGPLLNMKGEAVGVTTSTLNAFVSESGVDIPQNVNYAVKSAYILALLSSLPKNTNYPIVTPTKSRLEDIVPKVQDSIVQLMVKSK